MSSSQPFIAVEAGPASRKEGALLAKHEQVLVPHTEHVLMAKAPELAQAPAETRFLPDIKQFIPTIESIKESIKAAIISNPFESAALALTGVLLLANGFFAAAVVGGILAVTSYSRMPKFFKWATFTGLALLALGFAQTALTIALITGCLGLFYWLAQALRGDEKPR